MGCDAQLEWGDLSGEYLGELDREKNARINMQHYNV